MSAATIIIKLENVEYAAEACREVAKQIENNSDITGGSIGWSCDTWDMEY